MTAPQPLRTEISVDALVRGITTASDDPLERITSAVLTAEHLGSVADQLIGHFVESARATGASWREIGRAMGVTKQAAQKRFVGATRRPVDTPQQPDPALGFAKFTPAARNAIAVAHDAARSAGATELGLAHLTLGLLAEPQSGAVRAMDGIDVSAITADLRASLPDPAENPPELVPFDAAARDALPAAFVHAQRLDAELVGTVHLLLAVLEHAPSGALARAGVTAAGVERRVRDHSLQDPADAQD